MRERHAIVCSMMMTMTLGCLTSEPVNLLNPDAGGQPVMSSTGAAGQTGSSGQAGTPGIVTSGNAGASAGGPTGVAGSLGSAGNAGGAGSVGAAGSAGAGSNGQAGQAGSTLDAGATAGGNGTNVDAGATKDAGAGEVSAYAATWTDIYNKMLNNPSYASNCTGGSCHNPGTQKGLDLSTQAKGYTTIKSKLVVGNPSASTVVSQLSSGKMPEARPKMPTVDLNVIKAWIMAGAPNN